tara:strand:+ start:2296 stop:3195 length:900 start_codon:yes stop_codon:yes gene_type:complete
VGGFFEVYLSPEVLKMKIFILFVALMAGGFLLIPTSDVHSAKVARFIEGKTTFNTSNIIEDPESAIFSIKQDYQDSLKKSGEKIYSLEKQKNRLFDRVASNYAQLDILRNNGNEKREGWISKKAVLKKLKDENNFIFLKLKELNDDISGGLSNKDEIKTLTKSLRESDESINLLSFEIERISMEMLDYKNQIINLETSTDHSSEQLKKNLESTKKAFAFETALRSDLHKIVTVEIDAAMAGRDSDLTQDGDLKLLDHKAEISAIEDLLDRKNREYLSTYTAKQHISNDELLTLIYEEGF